MNETNFDEFGLSLLNSLSEYTSDIKKYQEVYRPNVLLHKSRTEKLALRKRYDILLGLIYLYYASSTVQEVSDHIYKDWGISITHSDIGKMLTHYKQRKIYSRYHCYNLLHHEFVGGLNDKQKEHTIFLPDMTLVHRDNVKLFPDDAFVKRKEFLKFKDKSNNSYKIQKQLIIKRLCYAYNVSDMEIIENYVFETKKTLDPELKNLYFFHSQIEYFTFIDKLDRGIIGSASLNNG